MAIIDTTDRRYIEYRKKTFPKGSGIYNGAYFYSNEIASNIIPRVKTNRDWDTLGMRCIGSMNGAIVFIHHCINWDTVYDWLGDYDDQIYIVSTRPTYEWFVKHGKRTILLPLSIDVAYVSQFAMPKTKHACYAGNRWAFKRKDEERNIPADVEFPPKNIPRDKLLSFIAPYRELYAIGRCALEGLVLGCKIQPFYHVYPDPSYWRILDNADAATMLQKALDMIEHGARCVDCFAFSDYQALSRQ